MLVGLSGPTITLSTGDEHDFPQDEAIRFIEAGFAVPVSEQIIETAAVAPKAERRKKKA
jgi:hypothetical protein